MLVLFGMATAIPNGAKCQTESALASAVFVQPILGLEVSLNEPLDDLTVVSGNEDVVIAQG